MGFKNRSVAHRFIGPVVIKLKNVAFSVVVLIGLVMMITDVGSR